MTWKLYQAVAPNGKRYFGITSKAFARRIKGHRDAVKSGSQLPFHRALRKYQDAMIFQLLVVGPKEYILNLEQSAIKTFETRNSAFGYNVTRGGDESPMKTPEIAAKVSATKKGIRPSAESIAKGAAARTGLKKSSKTRQKISASVSARISKNGHPWKDRKHSDETKAKMRISRAARPPISNETREKMKLAKLPELSLKKPRRRSLSRGR